jgi:hypothetical protein
MHLMNEQEAKNTPRISFSKEKVGQYSVGASGITGTSSKVTNPSGKVDFENGSYNASELLLENIDKLGQVIQQTNEYYAVPIQVTHALHYDELEEELDFDLETEEELAKNLDKHFNKAISTSNSIKKSKVGIKDNFCRLCGNKFGNIDKFCGRCGNARLEEA